MADILKIYKDNEVVGQGERGENNKGEVNIDGLEANTVYEKGTFKAAWSNDDGESEKEDVPEIKTKPIKVTGVSVDKETLNLNVGDEDTIKATVAPSTASDKSVAFASSNKAVATVDENGKVTAVAAGIVNIEVTTNDGNKKATCKVAVEEQEQTPEAPQKVAVEANENDANVTAE